MYASSRRETATSSLSAVMPAIASRNPALIFVYSATMRAPGP